MGSSAKSSASSQCSHKFRFRTLKLFLWYVRSFIKFNLCCNAYSRVQASCWGWTSDVEIIRFSGSMSQNITSIYSLSRSEWVHHLVLIPTIAAPGIMYNWGILGSYQLFFMCGLPGGISYFILATQILGYMHDFNEKRMTCNLNVWMRCPGIISTTCIAYHAVIYDLCNVPWCALSFQMFLPPVNAIYYAKQSVVTYAMNHTMIYGKTKITTDCF